MRQWILAMILAATAAGCTAAVPRDRITLAVLGGVYLGVPSDAKVEGAMVEDAESLLRKAVADLNARKDLDFVIVSGDLLARADGANLDRSRAILAELRAPYVMVLGLTDGPAPSGGGLSRSDVTWAFQGHGFQGPEGYWSREILPGLVLVGLDTVQPGRREGRVDARQLEWLEQTLTAAEGKSVLVAMYHQATPMHPLDEGAAWKFKMIDNAAAVRQALDRHRNVLAVVSGAGHFSAGHVGGRIVYLAAPSVSVWPLAYQLIRMTPKEVEAVWVPVADDDLSRRAQDRLLASPLWRGVFPTGEDGDSACVRLFGGKKLEVYALPAIRP